MSQERLRPKRLFTDEQHLISLKHFSCRNMEGDLDEIFQARKEVLREAGWRKMRETGANSL
ncbi:hypothetical protein HHS34_004770 [Acidithiobacillus montserratensis]|uniref:Uncharacterized protein n=1 Tax=Acidithiobacillus montserratensis TaxID=2729135 RepID=A0ACD5HJ40_9PROT|nr:hypothetical protein [Acidithiobacillus montserratensis]MBU2746695.1 hypothetical protein [Acidithiobacillus montserratensis]